MNESLKWQYWWEISCNFSYRCFTTQVMFMFSAAMSLICRKTAHYNESWFPNQSRHIWNVRKESMCHISVKTARPNCCCTLQGGWGSFRSSPQPPLPAHYCGVTIRWGFRDYLSIAVCCAKNDEKRMDICISCSWENSFILIYQIWHLKTVWDIEQNQIPYYSWLLGMKEHRSGFHCARLIWAMKT